MRVGLQSLFVCLLLACILFLAISAHLTDTVIKKTTVHDGDVFQSIFKNWNVSYKSVQLWQVLILTRFVLDLESWTFIIYLSIICVKGQVTILLSVGHSRRSSLSPRWRLTGLRYSGREKKITTVLLQLCLHCVYVRLLFFYIDSVFGPVGSEDRLNLLSDSLLEDLDKTLRKESQWWARLQYYYLTAQQEWYCVFVVEAFCCTFLS